MTTPNPSLDNTALTVNDRAFVALGSSKAESELIGLAESTKSITAITNKDGRTECHAAAMKAKDARLGVEKAGKAAREDATAFSKAVIAEEQRLVGLIAPEERRLLNLRDDWDAAAKAEKEAAEAAERAKLAAIQEKIDQIKRAPMDAALLDSNGVQLALDAALGIEIDSSYGESFGDAKEALAGSIAKLREILAAKISAEAVAERIKAEQAAEATRLAEESKRLAAERAELDRQRKEIEEAQAAGRRAAQESAAKAEAERLDAESGLRAIAATKPNDSQPAINEANTDHIEQPLVMVEKQVDTNVSFINEGKTIKLGEICTRLGFTVSAEFLASLGFEATIDRSAKLYSLAKFPSICRCIADHTLSVAFKQAA